MNDDHIAEELLKFDLLPEDVENPKLFVEKLNVAETREDYAEILAMIKNRAWFKLRGEV